MGSMDIRYISTIVFTAILGVFGIYHLISYFVLQHKILLYYALLIVGLTLHSGLYLIVAGTFSPEISQLADNASLITAMLTTFGFLKFTQNYLSIEKEEYPQLYKTYRLLILLVFVLPVLHILNILTEKNALLYRILELCAACTALVTLIINTVSGFLLFKTKRFNTFYLYANTPLLISGILYVTAWLLMDHLPINKPFVLMISSILITLQLILFSILIGFKFKYLEDENIKMQVAANELLKIEVNKQTKNPQIAKQKLEDQNRELVRVNKLKNKLFSLITHDISAPLVNLGQIVDVIESELANEEMKIFTGKLKSDISYKITMVNGLLQWSYNQLEGVQLNKEDCELQPIFSAIKKEFEKMGKDKQIDISLNVGCKTLFIDKNMLLVILRNLTSNAIKFSENGQKVVLWSHDTPEVIEVGVRDYGVGMDMDWYKNLGKQDAPKTSLGTDGEKGTGFGLIIAKDFTEMNGGSLRCESTKGAGTNFIMRFTKE